MENINNTVATTINENATKGNLESKNSVSIQEAPITSLSQAVGNEVAVNDHANTEINTITSMFSEVDINEFEDACKPETLENISQAVLSGALRPEGLCPIEIMADGVTGLYAKRLNTFKGKSNVAIVYYRSDGSCTEDILISNADLYLIIAAAQSWATADVVKDAKRALKKIEKTLLDYWDGIVFNAADVVKRLAMNLPKLPIDNSHVPDIKIVYSTILDYVNKWAGTPLEDIFFRRGFYALPPDHFEDIADSLQMTTKNLAEFLKRNGLLYLQNSSVGYQCKVRGWDYCYCVRTLKEYQRDVEPYGPVDMSTL